MKPRAWPVATVADALGAARRLRLDPRDAELLIAHHLNRPRTWVVTHTDNVVSLRSAHAITIDFVRRQKGYPLAYLLGSADFYGIELTVSPAVLIPRPETELLVEEALRRIPISKPFRIADIGTGSGAVAIALAVNRPNLRLVAIDVSPKALLVARSNIRRHNVTKQVRLVRGNLAVPLIQYPVDAIVGNLPYLPSGPVPDVEPPLALRGGADGLKHFRTFFHQLKKLSSRPRFILLEIDPRNLMGLKKLVPSGYRTTVLRDLAGRNRLLALDLNT